MLAFAGVALGQDTQETVAEAASEPTSEPTTGTTESAPVADGSERASSEPRSSRRRHRTRSARSSRRSRSSRRTAAIQREAHLAAARVALEELAGSVSVGRHNAGRLVNGRQLTASELVRLKNPTGDHHWGTDELVTLLERGAAAVASVRPGVRLTVGDLSRRRGGPFRPHRSHRSGRDVDVGFFVSAVTGGEPVDDLQRFIVFRRDGLSPRDETLRFDDERNWLFVQELITQQDVPVQYMFVSRELRDRLIAEGQRQGASEEILARAAVILDQPSRGGAHRDHFHVRIYCPDDDRPRCQDDAPYHPWVVRTPRPVAAESASSPRRSRRHASTRPRAAG